MSSGYHDQNRFSVEDLAQRAFALEQLSGDYKLARSPVSFPADQSRANIRLKHGIELIDLNNSFRLRGSNSFKKLDESYKKAEITDQEFRFNCGRILARYLIMQARKGRLDCDSSLLDFINNSTFKESLADFERSITDCLSCALLMPFDLFEPVHSKNRHDIFYLSALFDVPTEAIALRQRIVAAHLRANQA